MIYVTNFVLVPKLALIPSAFTIYGALIFSSIFRFGWFDFLPLAKQSAKKMGDALIILDLEKNVVVLNPAAEEILCLRIKQVIGENANQLLESQDNLHHHFHHFFSNKQDGTGLGLWISRNIIHQHGEEIDCENLKEVEGVCFTITLPIVEKGVR